MKKIVALSHTSDYTGGAESVLLNLIRCTLSIYSWTVIVPVSYGKFYEEVSKINGVCVVNIFTPWWCSGSSYGQFVSRSAFKKSLSEMSNIVKESDICFTNTMTNPWLAYCAMQNCKPHIWYVHEFGVIDHGLSFAMGYKKSIEFVLHSSDRVLTVSNSVKSYMGEFVENNKTEVIPQSIDLEKLGSLKHEIINKNSDLRILLLGSIKPSKGQKILLDAIKSIGAEKFGRISVRISGPIVDSDYFSLLKNMSNKYKLPVEFNPSFVDAPKEYTWSNVVVVPSLNEAFGRTTIEALASGRVVIGSSSGATPDLLSGRRGLLFAKNNPKSLAQKILELQERGEYDLLDVAKRKVYVSGRYSSLSEKRSFINTTSSLEYSKKSVGFDLVKRMGRHGLYEWGIKFFLRKYYVRSRQVIGRSLRLLKLKK